MILTCRSTDLVSVPLNPRMRRVKFPGDALGPAMIVSVEIAEASGRGVIGLGMVNVVSVGAAETQDAESSTAELNPLCERTVIVAVAVDDWLTETVVFEIETEKSGSLTAVTTSARVAVCVISPPVPMIVIM